MRECTLCLHTILEDVYGYFRLRKKRKSMITLVGCRTAYVREEPAAFIFYPDDGRTCLWNTDTPYRAAWNHLTETSDLARCWKFLSVMQIIHRELS
jgi:hypothetical protein